MPRTNKNTKEKDTNIKTTKKEVLRDSFYFEGKRYFVYSTNEEELQEKKFLLKQKLNEGILERSDPTLSKYFENWTSDREGMVSDATLRTQSKIFSIIKSIPVSTLKIKLGDMKLKKITIHDLREIQQELKLTRKARTVNDYMALLKHIFSDAKKELIISYNPAEQLKNFKCTEETARDTNHRALTIEEQTAFFSCERCKKSYYYNVFKFAILTGMRIGEIGALKVRDIDDELIHVQRTITRLKSGTYVIGDDAKTKAGRRVIPINDKIRTIVTEQKEINRIIDGKVCSVGDLLFKAAERGLLMATPIDREIKKICKISGVEPFTMHALRATFATRCIEAGMNPKTLQEILGHSNFNITMSLYGHCLTDTKKKEMGFVNIDV